MLRAVTPKLTYSPFTLLYFTSGYSFIFGTLECYSVSDFELNGMKKIMEEDIQESGFVGSIGTNIPVFSELALNVEINFSSNYQMILGCLVLQF